MDFGSYIIFSRHFEIETPYEISVDLVGQKSMGILDCPVAITPPFFIITSNLFREWLADKNSAEALLQSILATYSSKLNLGGTVQYIVRSSAKYEDFDERGFYKSSQGGISYGNLLSTIKEIWTQNLEGYYKFKDNEFALVIQQYIRSKLAGHLSNERRVSRNEPDWLIEIVNDKGEFQGSGKFNVLKTRRDELLKPLISNNRKDLLSNLKNVAATITEKRIRCHLEWVWDGKIAWIVQKDKENNSGRGSKPGSQWKTSKKIIDKNDLSSFNTVSTTNSNWKKIKCIKTFIDCGLPHGDVYILENAAQISRISEGIFDDGLINDLQWLLLYPIVIRMDVTRTDDILLPRTETLFTFEEAKSFLTAKALDFKSKGLKSDEFCFLIHRFIISKSCALAFSKPNLQKARIDSTWGIVDGLYYHPHDSFEINLANKPPQVKKQIRCKTEYIDVGESGKWFSKSAGVNWDWAESLTKEQIINISEYNTKISDHLNSPVTVMYFVDVDRSTGYPPILPWYYTTEEIADNSEKFTDVIFSENRELIQSENDFELFKKKVEGGIVVKTTIKLKLNPDILRDKPLIEDIGTFAKSKHIPIELEGSILAHTYYILRKTGALVKCISPFDPKYKKQKFYKLVRDKIPINIESKGEKVRTVKIDSAQLLTFLKKKAIEEAYEFFWEAEHDKVIEELADLFEVVRAACKIFGIPITELEHIANKKSEKKGSFESGVVLLDTTESSLIDVVDNTDRSLLIEDSHTDIGFVKNRGKAKIEKIAIGVDKSLTLPFILGNDKSEGTEINALVTLEGIESIKIEYTARGIKIKFIQKKETAEPKSQLSLF
jgi:predicted house-cleaning noncanonical NTP pyrophosphatase (MazG superfamily)